MTKNDDIKPEGGNDQPEDISAFEELRRWEQNEKARTMIESGDMGGSSKSLKHLSKTGLGGEYDSVLRAAVVVAEKHRKQCLRQARLDAEKAFPEIYPHHSLGKMKQGKRQIKDDSQTYLTKKQFIELYSGISFANAFGVALYARVTILWKMLGYTDHIKAAEALQNGFFDPLDRWYKYNNTPKNGVKHIHPLYWAYTHENSKKAGFHTHIIIGIPMELRKKFRVWARERVAELSKIKPVNKECIKVTCPPSDPVGRQWRSFQYMCKGIDQKATVEIPGYPEPVPMFQLIEPNYESPGHIACKNRMGMSTRMRISARRKNIGFISWMEKGVFDRRIVYTSNLYDTWHALNALNAKRRKDDYDFQTPESFF